MKHPERLIQAAALIEAHMATLNIEQATCPCCEVIKYENFNDFKAFTELGTMARKLRSRFGEK